MSAVGSGRARKTPGQLPIVAGYGIVEPSPRAPTSVALSGAGSRQTAVSRCRLDQLPCTSL